MKNVVHMSRQFFPIFGQKSFSKATNLPDVGNIFLDRSSRETRVRTHTFSLRVAVHLLIREASFIYLFSAREHGARQRACERKARECQLERAHETKRTYCPRGAGGRPLTGRSKTLRALPYLRGVNNVFTAHLNLDIPLPAAP